MNSIDRDVSRTPDESESKVAVVCTLGADERTDRGLEWADLGALALTSDRIDGGVASTYPIDVADAVEDLAHRESGCCGSWLDVTTERLGEVVRLEITTGDPDGLGLILKMAGHTE